MIYESSSSECVNQPSVTEETPETPTPDLLLACFPPRSFQIRLPRHPDGSWAPADPRLTTGADEACKYFPCQRDKQTSEPPTRSKLQRVGLG